MSTTGEATRAAIRDAAVVTFCSRGYNGATLEEVGSLAGCTRGTVLHHFNSKSGLLSAVASPYLMALGELLHASVVHEPPSSRQRRRLLERFADLFFQHRAVVQLLANDVAARSTLQLAGYQLGHRDRLVALLIGAGASPAAQVRTAAALGTLIHPIAGRWLECFDTASRDELIESALLVIDRPMVPREAQYAAEFAGNLETTAATSRDRY